MLYVMISWQTNYLWDFGVITVFFCNNGYQMLNCRKTIKYYLLNAWEQFSTGSCYFFVIFRAYYNLVPVEVKYFKFE